MFGLKLFGGKSGGRARAGKSPATGVLVVARLNARVQPVDRGEYFEDPLDAVLREAGLGEVTGGGTQLAEEPAGIEFCVIEILLADATDASLDALAAALDALGAPKGSRLIVEAADADRAIGVNEGLGLFLNGTDLPTDVYRSCDVNHVISELDRLMGAAGKFMGHWEGSRETALYCYGPQFAAMHEAIAPLVEGFPLCARARIEQIA